MIIIICILRKHQDWIEQAKIWVLSRYVDANTRIYFKKLYDADLPGANHQYTRCILNINKSRE